MRASHHSGRVRKDGKAYAVRHNDRCFTSKDDQTHDKSREHMNRYWAIDENDALVPTDGVSVTFEQAERAFYRRKMSDTVETRNARNRKYRHPERCITVDDYYTNPRSCPEEVILQIGKEGSFNSPELFAECVSDYVHEHEKRFPTIKIISVAIHADETSLHAHIRKVYLAADKDGNTEAHQAHCLEKMGYSPPHPEQKTGRFNNAKIPYSHDIRDLWLSICEGHGIQIEREPESPSRESRNLDDYKNYIAKEKAARSEAELSELRKRIREEQERAAAAEQKARDARNEMKQILSEVKDAKGRLTMTTMIEERFPEIFDELAEEINSEYGETIEAESPEDLIDPADLEFDVSGMVVRACSRDDYER